MQSKLEDELDKISQASERSKQKFLNLPKICVTVGEAKRVKASHSSRSLPSKTLEPKVRYTDSVLLASPSHIQFKSPVAPLIMAKSEESHHISVARLGGEKDNGANDTSSSCDEERQ